MDFDLSAEQVMLQEAAQRYIREHPGVPARRTITASEHGFSPGRWADFAALGWLAVLIPDDAGGLGGTDVDLALLVEELGRGLSAEALCDTAVLGATLIQASANTTLRNDLLNRIAAGDCRTALAHVEPGGRSEYETTVATKAVSSNDSWRISGIKHRVVNGTAATHWLVSARTGDATQPGLFLVESGATGVSCTDYALIDGCHACDLAFTNVPALLLLTPEQSPTLEWALDRTLVALSAAAVGSMEAVMSLCAEHLKQRVQFGQTLSKFQALQHRMAEIFIETDQARSMLYQALAALESADPDRRRRGVSGAKWLVARSGNFVVSQGIQLHGGIGITEEYAVAHHYRSMLVFDKRFGDAAFHLRRSAGLAQGPR